MDAALGSGRRLPIRPHASARAKCTRSTRRRRRSAARCTSATSSPTRTPTSIARFQRMRGKAVFYPMGWDDNGLPTERRVQNYYGVRCDPSLPYDPAFAPPEKPGKQPVSVSRPNFIELCARLTVEDEKAFERCGGTSAVGRLVDDLRDDRPRVAARVAAGVSAPAEARPRLPGRGADAVGRGLPDRRRAGRARGSRAAGRVSIASGSRRRAASARSSRSKPRGRS